MIWCWNSFIYWCRKYKTNKLLLFLCVRPRCARWHRQLWITRKNHFVVLVFIVGEKKKKKKSFPGSTVDVHSPDMHTGRSHAVNIVTKLPHRPDKVTHCPARATLQKNVWNCEENTPRTSLERPSSTSQPFYAPKDGGHRCRRGYRDGAVISIRSL